MDGSAGDCTGTKAEVLRILAGTFITWCSPHWQEDYEELIRATQINKYH